MRTNTANVRLLLLLALTGCSSLNVLPWLTEGSQRAPSTRAEVDERIRGLVNLKGEYWLGDGVYSLMDNEVPVRAIAAADTVAIRSLVACLADARPTHITLRGERVAVGLLCAEALTRTTYFQTGLRRRAFPESWAGVPPLSTDSLALGRMQRAWFQWLQEHELAWPLLPASALPCPSRESLKAERFRESASMGEQGRIRLREAVADYRFVTYVVDSEFVLLSDSRPRSASDSTRAGVLEGLSAEDIESVSVLKSESEAWKWRACEGVPVVLVQTRSKRWRPRVPEPRRPE